MINNYMPKKYWNERLLKNFNLKGVGHSSFSQWYNYWLYKAKKRKLNKYFKNYFFKNTHVLDIGCGTGFFIKWYLKKGARIDGIDIAEVSINKLKKKYTNRADLYLIDISDKNFKPIKKYDIINIWDVIYHITDEKAFTRTIINISKSLKKDGYILLTDWLNTFEKEQIEQHIKKRNLNNYQYIFKKVKFQLIMYQPIYNWLNKRRIPFLDNIFAPFYYFLDKFIKKMPDDNLYLGIWRKI